MALQHSVDNLIAQVRSRLDLATNEGVKDTNDILPALNRGKDYAFNILARHYPEPLLTSLEVNVSSATFGDIPDDAFEDRLLKVDWKDNTGLYRELDRLNYREKQDYESVGNGIPEYHTIVGHSYELVPNPQNGTVRIWYLQEPEDYVKSLGRITGVSLADQTLSLDSINSSLTTSTASLGAYINIIDGKTGIVKYSAQVKTIDNDNSQIITKSTPSRTTVLGRTIQSDLTDLDITEDDHICAINGTCIPYFKKPVSNFVIEYATAEMKDKLQREGQDMAQRVLEKFEQQVERTWVRREVVRRIRRENKQWRSGYQNGLFWLRSR